MFWFRGQRVVVRLQIQLAAAFKTAMLSPLKELVRDYRMVLASTSTQRKVIWHQMGFDFDAVPSSFDEDGVQQGQFSDPGQYVIHLAKGKTQAVKDKLKDRGSMDSTIVVGADTVIISDNAIIGKPHTDSKAIQTLQLLSGKTHQVITGVSIHVAGKMDESIHDEFVTTTEVTFSSLNDELIKSYVKTGEPLNKAGAYGIQGLGSRLVKGIVGDYYNVVGFPINEFCDRLEKLLTSQLR